MLKIGLFYSESSLSFADTFIRCHDELKPLEISLTFHQDEVDFSNYSYDIYFIDYHLFCPIKTAELPKVVVLEKSDCASVYARESLMFDNVVGMIKVAKLKPEYENFMNYRFHEFFLGKSLDETIRYICPEDLNKVVAGPHFAMYKKMNSLQHNRIGVKNNDVHCVLSTENYSPYIKTHREKCLSIINESGLKTIAESGRIYTAKQYRRQILDSKIIVSPWGNGEACYRDIEAMLSGCLLIKPNSEFMEQLGSPLVPYETYIPCEPDFSDLNDLLQYYTANFSETHEMRIKNLKMCKDLFDPKYTTHWILKYVKGLLK